MPTLPSDREWGQRCAADGEFRLAARHWTGGVRLRVGRRTLTLALSDGAVSADGGDGAMLEYAGTEAVWDHILAPVPPPFHNDLMAALTMGTGLSRSGDPVRHAQYYAAVMRAVELLRPELPAAPIASAAATTPVGRYHHLELNGVDHRIYLEEAGQGIPLLLQHTAGCHGSQWRHLFEAAEITRRFRLIAYDLPYHGKSLPPTGPRWWAEPYVLTGELLRAVPLGLVAALGLERPVFMGCSVGGLLALDLAWRHADLFRAVIAVEGALKVEGDLAALTELWHPQVSNEYKARLMEGLMAPGSPRAYRKETAFVYASGWPPSFLGDLHYYLDEFDLRAVASHIDTSRVGVHILSGEYDYSGRPDLGRAAHEAIAGSTFTEMVGMGHFPMSEHPQAFIDYLMPVLASVCAEPSATAASPTRHTSRRT